jgi:hypothetical protein
MGGPGAQTRRARFGRATTERRKKGSRSGEPIDALLVETVSSQCRTNVVDGALDARLQDDRELPQVPMANLHSFLSLNSPSITVLSGAAGALRPAAKLVTDDIVRSIRTFLNQGKVRTKAIVKPTNSAGTVSPCVKKRNRHSASKLTITGRRTGFGSSPTMRGLPLLIQGNLAKRQPRSRLATNRLEPR